MWSEKGALLDLLLFLGRHRQCRGGVLRWQVWSLAREQLLNGEDLDPLKRLEITLERPGAPR
jgi:hypothetical protein